MSSHFDQHNTFNDFSFDREQVGKSVLPDDVVSTSASPPKVQYLVKSIDV